MIGFLVVLVCVLRDVASIEIDSQLGNILEDCFERISIGEQLPNNAIYRIIPKLTARGCEKICHDDRRCQSYDFGVGLNGNTSCGLSRRKVIEITELIKNPDFDIYTRRIDCEQAPPKPFPFDRPVLGPTIPNRPNKPNWPSYNKPSQNNYINKPNFHDYTENLRPDGDNYHHNGISDPNSLQNDLSSYKPVETWIRLNRTHRPKPTYSYDILISHDIVYSKPHLGYGYSEPDPHKQNNLRPDPEFDYDYFPKRPNSENFLSFQNNSYSYYNKDQNNGYNRKVYDIQPSTNEYYSPKRPNRPFYGQYWSNDIPSPINSNFIHHFNSYTHQNKPFQTHDYHKPTHQVSNYYGYYDINYHRPVKKPHDDEDLAYSYRPNLENNLRPDPESFKNPDQKPYNGILDQSNKPYQAPSSIYEFNWQNHHQRPNYHHTKNHNYWPNQHQQRPSHEEIPNYGQKPAAIRPSGYYNQLRPKPGQPASYAPCFRRVLAGRRAVRSHVRRVHFCETLEDCRRECATEKRFHCESFNYRIDQSIRGKGLCELMTKPIEAFDLQKDFVDDKNYDFYEVDRNSLEPDCPETLKGPGQLHSGYLSSNEGWSPERWDDKYPNQVDNGWRRGDLGCKSCRPAYQGKNIENYGKYGGSYGNYDSYYQNRNDYRNSLEHWRLSPDEPDPYAGVKPFRPPNFNYYDLGRPNSFNQYGYGHQNRDQNGFHYGESNYYKPIKPSYLDESHYSSKPHYVEKPIYIEKPYIEKPVYIEKPYFEKPVYIEKPYVEKPVYIEKPYVEKPVFIEKPYDDKPVYIDQPPPYAEEPQPPFYPEHPSPVVIEHEYHDPKPVQIEHGSREPPVYLDGPSYPVSTEVIATHGCTPYRQQGMTLGANAIKRALIAQNVVECEAACFNEQHFKCVSYSYKYSNVIGSENCFLSERPYKGAELTTDTSSDVYSMTGGGTCQVNQTPFVESECFWHVRSGCSVATPERAVVAAGLGACEAECIRAHDFFCRGFSFRFDQSPQHGPNCLLTSSPPSALSLSSGLSSDSSHELYARGNYGRGCEPALYTDDGKSTECYLQYDKEAKLIGSAIKGRARVSSDRDCGQTCTDAPFKCLSYSYFSSPQPDGYNCFLSDVRLFDLRRGVDYEHQYGHTLFSFDLFNSKCWKRLHGDVITNDHRPESNADPSSPDFTAPSYPPRTNRPSGPPSGLSYGPERTDFVPSGLGPSRPHHRPHYPTTGGGYDYNEYPVSRPYPPNIPPRRPTYPSRPDYGPPRPDRPDYIPKRPSHLPHDGDEESLMVSWRHYTVSGLPCKRGTVCEQNHISGHWACEPEGGEYGAWDYCCAPSHRCGYSEGFHKPWCYVGPEETQWRPCSEKYYPYHQHTGPHPFNGYRDRPRPQYDYMRRPANYRRPVYLSREDRGDFPSGPYLPEEDRRYWDELYKNGPKAYYDKYGNPLPGFSKVPPEDHVFGHGRRPSQHGSDGWVPLVRTHDEDELEPPLPGGLGVARYWPVAYLHKGPPPNMTYFKYNETDQIKTTTQKYDNTTPNQPSEFRRITPERDNNKEESTNYRTAKDRDMSVNATANLEKIKMEEMNETVGKEVKTTESTVQVNTTDSPKTEEIKAESTKRITGKLEDFSGSIEILDFEDAKSGEKTSELKTLEEEERQIEAIGRLLAIGRDEKINLEKRSDVTDREKPKKGIIERVTKDQIVRERNIDKSLEVSETTYVRPPRILNSDPRRQYVNVNGKLFYDAMLRENSKREPKSLENKMAPSVLTQQSNSRKNLRVRNANPVRRVRRIYRRKYNPEEVRKRLLEREKSKQEINEEKNNP